MAASDQRFRDPLCPHTEHIVAEAVNAVRYERAVTLADILLRRVPVALSACWSGSCTEIAARRIGQALRWSESEIDEQIASLETKVLSPVRVLPDLAA
jgi:glycerol-3-phosphate dehydrogenase